MITLKIIWKKSTLKQETQRSNGFKAWIVFDKVYWFIIFRRSKLCLKIKWSLQLSTQIQISLKSKNKMILITHWFKKNLQKNNKNVKKSNINKKARVKVQVNQSLAKLINRNWFQSLNWYKIR
jgi:hypothetical protein